MAEGGRIEAELVNPSGAGAVLLVCEHASNFVPAEYQGLGLVPHALTLHSAWDIGAAGARVEIVGRAGCAADRRDGLTASD